MPPQPTDLHDLISFDDPDEDRTWIFDATFLRSDWSCIFGVGCQGIRTEPTPDAHQGCCSLGAHFIDEKDLKRVKKAAARLDGSHWQFRAQAGKKFWRKTEDDDLATKLADDACIFLNRPGFEGGIGCALHHGALAAGERPLDWKPTVCWQLPLRLEEETDAHGHITSILREWKRRDWGEGGAEFAWWCTDSPLAFVGEHPVYTTLKDEIIEIVGPKVYKMLVERLEGPVWVPHPALRKKQKSSK